MNDTQMIKELHKFMTALTLECAKDHERIKVLEKQVKDLRSKDFESSLSSI